MRITQEVFDRLLSEIQEGKKGKATKEDHEFLELAANCRLIKAMSLESMLLLMGAPSPTAGLGGILSAGLRIGYEMRCRFEEIEKLEAMHGPDEEKGGV